jgi:hypothetical protein
VNVPKLPKLPKLLLFEILIRKPSLNLRMVKVVIEQSVIKHLEGRLTIHIAYLSHCWTPEGDPPDEWDAKGKPKAFGQ